MAANIFSLLGSIFVDNTEANKSISKTSEEGEKAGGILSKLGGVALDAGKKIGQFAVGAATAAAGAATALVGMAMQSSEAASRVNDMAQSLGISNQAFQEWDYILGLNGASIDSFGVGMKTLQTKMVDFGEGGKAATELFDNLGISIEQVSQMSPEAAMEAVIQKLQEMPAGAEKADLALQAFGKQGMALMPVLNSTAEETEALKQKAHDLSMVMSEESVKAGDDFGDALDTAKGMVKGLANNLGAELLPSMTAGIEAFIGFASGADEGSEKLEEAIDGIVTVITKQLPAFLEKGGQIVIKVVEGITTALPKLVESIMPIIPDVVKLIVTLLPLLVQAGIDILVSVINGISQALPDLIPAVVEIIMTIVTSIIDNLPKLLEAALNIIVALAEGILKAIPVLIEKLPALIISIIDFILKAIPQLIEAGIQLFIALVEALPEIIVAIVEAIPKIITGIINALMDNLDKIIDAGIKLLIALVTNLPAIITEIVKAVPKIITAIVKGFTDSASKMSEVGSNLIEGLWKGISDAGKWLHDKISGFFGGVVDNIKNFFGIQSPSKLFAYFGEMNMEGFAQGVEGMKNRVDGAVDNVFGDLGGDVDYGINANFNISKGKPAMAAANASSGQQSQRPVEIRIENTFIINSDRDIEKVGQKINDDIIRKTRSKGGVLHWPK